MALFECKKCGHKISDKAAACIYCGCDINVAKGINAELTINQAIKEYLSTEEDIQDAKNEIICFYDILKKHCNLEEQEPTIFAFKETEDEELDFNVEEFYVKDDWDVCDEECEEIFQDIQNDNDLDHIICFYNDLDIEDEFEMYYAAKTLDVVIKGTIKGDYIKYELLPYNKISNCLFSTLFWNMGIKQAEIFVPLMQSEIYAKAFCTIDYFETYMDTKYSKKEWGGDFFSKNFTVKFIKEKLGLNVKYPYAISFLPSGEILAITQITNDIGKDLYSLGRKCHEQHDKNPIDNFYTSILPNLCDPTQQDQDLHLVGFITDCGVNTIVFKNFCQETLVNEKDIESYNFLPHVFLFRQNIIEMIKECEDHLNMIMPNR